METQWIINLLSDAFDNLDEWKDDIQSYKVVGNELIIVDHSGEEFRIKVTMPMKEIPKPDPELVLFAYWLKNVGEIKEHYEIHFFADPAKYQKLWNAWLTLHREGFEDWQIEQKLTDHDNGGWKLNLDELEELLLRCDYCGKRIAKGEPCDCPEHDETFDEVTSD